MNVKNSEPVVFAKAVNRYVRLSPKKAQRVLRQLKGKTYSESILILNYLPYSACGPIWKTIYSAAANAENNKGLNKKNLMVYEAYATKGPVLKRFRPRAKGRGFRIKKPTCHLTITLGES